MRALIDKQYPLTSKLREKAVSHLINKFTQFKRRALQIVLLGLALLLLQTSLMAAPLVQLTLAPPDTSSPQATMRSFVENVNESYRILMAAYAQYLKEPGPFPSTSVKEQVKQAEIFFERAERWLSNFKAIAFRNSQFRYLSTVI